MGNGRPAVKDFQDLEVWQLGKQLALLAYKLTERFPPGEAFGLTGQIRRAALSVPANIAEAFGRYHYMDRVKFLLNAWGSLNELKSHFIIAEELQFVGHNDPAALACERKLIESLSAKLNSFITATRRGT
jgi:four helix bundle protein